VSNLPPEYEPVHHEPRRGRAPRPDALRQDSRGSGPWPVPPQPPQFPPPQQPQYQQPRFVPGFGDGHDAPDNPGGAGEWYEPQNYEQQSYDQQNYERQDYASQEPAEPRPPRRRRRRLRWLAPLVAVLIILVPIAWGGIYVYGIYQNKYHPADYSGRGTCCVQVQVPSGASASTLAPELVSLGVIASTRAFVLAAEHSANTAGLEPGTFRLDKHMQASLAYAALIDPKNVVALTVTIPEGWRMSRILATLMADDPHISQKAFTQALASKSLGLPAYADGKPEGYLFPDTYTITPTATALSVLQQMTQAFSTQAQTLNLTQAAKAVHLSPAQVITVASLVQAEGGKDSDFPKIARVIYNRLAQGMKLEFDSTVFYGLGTYGIAATDQQIASNSPYNTYKFAGLPPGPIDSPGALAIEAALKPAPGNWLYFVTVNPKTHETLFTASEAQFQQYQAELEQNGG
jgi:peptidoglycan lytic transglycosylase G